MGEGSRTLGTGGFRRVAGMVAVGAAAATMALAWPHRRAGRATVLGGGQVRGGRG